MSPILQIKNLKTYFYTAEGISRAVNGVSWNLDRRETLGIVGESGCGKSVTGLSILRLVASPPGFIVGGEILFEDVDLLTFSERQMRKVRGNKISMIFQDAMSSLDPVFTICNQVSEIFKIHLGCSSKEAREKTIEILNTVKIPAPERRLSEYPYQMSGGMQQRIMIAMALACRPQILIADEPTTALDVTIQAQILDLMFQLKEELGTAIIIISHDLGIISEVAQRVIIMYAGEIVEEAMVDELFDNPLHPYTRGLLLSMPYMYEGDAKIKRLQEIPGVVPSLHKLPKGCLFCPRCSESKKICREESPSWTKVSDKSSTRCWLYV